MRAVLSPNPGQGRTEKVPRRATLPWFRSTPRCGPALALRPTFGCVPENETAAAVACGNDAISVEARDGHG